MNMDITNDRDDDYYDPLLSSFFAQAMIDSPPARQFSPFTVTPAFLTDSSSSSYQQLPACIDHYFDLLLNRSYCDDDTDMNDCADGIFWTTNRILQQERRSKVIEKKA